SARSVGHCRTRQRKRASRALGLSRHAIGEGMLKDGLNPIALASRFAVAAMMGGAMCGGSVPAFAYRPFDGTDAAVAVPGQVEVELQPVGRLQEGAPSFLVAPGIVVNYGLTKGLEAVFEGRLLTPLSSSEPPNLRDAGTFLKYVLRPGVL